MKPNTRSTFATLGASNHVEDERQEKDFSGPTQLKWVN